VDDHAYFVTFNLHDAVPVAFRDQLRTEKRIRIAELERLKERATPAELHAIDRVLHERAEEHLDAGEGACWFRDPRIADLVANALTHFDQQRYRLLAWCVMPNHVHAVFEPGDTIARIVHSWKSFTAKRANKILRRAGEFWQEDYYDHTVRDAPELARVIEYVFHNPRKAKLAGWPWVRVYGERLSVAGREV